MDLNKKDLKVGTIVKTKSDNVLIYLGEVFLNIETGIAIKSDSYDERLNHYSENMQIVLVSIKSATENWKNFILKENPKTWDWEREDEVKYIGIREKADGKEVQYRISKETEVNKGDIVTINSKRYIVTDVGTKPSSQLLSELKEFQIDNK